MRAGLGLPPERQVFAGFAIYAFALASIFPRLPDIQAEMGVGEGALGLGLIGTPVGTLLSLTFAPPLLERMGYRRAILVFLPLIAASFAAASWAPNPGVLFLLLLPAGITIGCIEVIVNVEADRTEALIGRRIMNRAHSFWSFGFFGAGIVGGIIAQSGLSPQAHLALAVPVVALATLAVFGGYRPAPKRAGEGTGTAAPTFARPTAAILVLVAVTLSAMLMEGASLDWSAIYMRNVFAAEPWLSALAVASFAVAQALSRFFADGFVEHYSPAGVARTLIGVMTAGIAVVFLSPWPALSLAGFALLGVGTSAIFPLAMSAAAQRTDRPAAINVAALAQISFVIFLVGPPLLGFVAEHWGIRWAYGIGLPLVALSLAASGSLGRRAEPRAAQAVG
ncbi:MAG: MFS transporter [Amaricoccus sp.]|uniref:MFS transporter n=1 Tax=Amaricoccus sp. TaxID=1872485 RepID=UPI0039E412C7